MAETTYKLPLTGEQIEARLVQVDVIARDYLTKAEAVGNYLSKTAAAASADKTNIAKIATRITDLAASQVINTETIWFGGLDAVTFGCPETYCIVRIQKGDDHMTLLDCYGLNTGNRYTNSCAHADGVADVWTGWRLPTTDNLNGGEEVWSFVCGDSIENW